MNQTVQYSEQISKNGKTFHYAEQFFDFKKVFRGSVGLMSEMSSEAIEAIHLKFESRG